MDRSIKVAFAVAGVLAVMVTSDEPVRSAGTFTIDPTRIYMANNARSRELTLSNGGERTSRFVVTAFAWRQDRDGATLLDPTGDVIVSPAALAVAPRATGRIRITLRSPDLLGREERTYRIFVEEQDDARVTSGLGLRLLTRMSLPIFLLPDTSTVAAALGDPGVTNRTVTFSLRNTGTLHFLTAAIRVATLDTGGAVLAERTIPNEYVLPGSVRDFRWEMPASACAAAARLIVQVAIPGLATQEATAAAPAACPS